jgi:RNA polymerase sigma-70 factor (ECF subfamily)
MADFELPDEVRARAQRAWARYVDVLAPFRPDLHRYCRRLTGDLWDAEDLVQETVLRGFATLGQVHQTVANPRGYLVRIATRLWIDALRRRDTEARRAPELAAPGAALAPDRAAEARDAAGAALQRLSPQERAALVLKEVFEMSLDEIAETLATSAGAVKAALHRARERTGAALEQPSTRRTPSLALVDRFVACLEASDLPGLLALMLDGGSVEEYGGVLEVGRAQFEQKGTWLWHSVHVHPDLPPEVRPPKWVNERVVFRGEPIVLSFDPVAEGRPLMGIARLEEQDGRIARLRSYIFCPETLREVADELGLATGPALYRFPFLAQ